MLPSCVWPGRWPQASAVYLVHAGIQRQGGADHVDVRGGGGPLSGGEGSVRGRTWGDVVEGVRCGVSVIGAEGDRGGNEQH